MGAGGAVRGRQHWRRARSVPAHRWAAYHYLAHEGVGGSRFFAIKAMEKSDGNEESMKKSEIAIRKVCHRRFVTLGRDQYHLMIDGVSDSLKSRSLPYKAMTKKKRKKLFLG